MWELLHRPNPRFHLRRRWPPSTRLPRRWDPLSDLFPLDLGVAACSRLVVEGVSQHLIVDKPPERRRAPRCATCAGHAPDGMGRPKVRIRAVWAGLWSSEPLWPWATVGPGGIVNFFNFLWIYSKLIQIQFSLNWNLLKFIQTEYLNQFNPSQLIQIGKSELGFQIQLNLIKPFGKYS
jgi:hypothetical protein